MSKRKNKKPIQNNNQQDKNELTRNELEDVLNFAANYYNTVLGNIVPQSGMINVATPELVNQALQNITTNPMEATESSVNEALLNPKNNQDKLMGFMEYFEMVDMLTKKTLYYLGNLPSFDLTYYCNNIEDKSEYKSDEYKKDYNIMKKFFSKFNYKQQFQNIMRNLLRRETGYYIFRNDAKQYVFQELPPQFSKITGKWEYGLLYDFNMYWFLSPGVNIDEYPTIMKKMYVNLLKEKELYNPANPIGRRDGTWSYWTQTDPTKGFWAFKFNIDNYTNVPYLSATFPDAVLRPLYRKLQKNQSILAAQKVMVGLIPLLKNAKSGEVKDQFAISPKQMGVYLGLLKQGLSDTIKVGGVPFEDVKVLDFPVSDTNMYDSYNSTSSALSGVTQRIVYSSDRMSAAEMEASKEVDEMIVTYVYPMFENFLNYQVNSLTKKYKFTFKLEGSKFSSNRKERFDQWHKNASLGIVLPQKLAAAMGMTPFEFESQMEEASSSEFTKNLIGLMNLNTATTTASNNPGRNKKDVNEVADSTERKYDKEEDE